MDVQITAAPGEIIEKFDDLAVALLKSDGLSEAEARERLAKKVEGSSVARCTDRLSKAHSADGEPFAPYPVLAEMGRAAADAIERRRATLAGRIAAALDAFTEENAP